VKKKFRVIIDGEVYDVEVEIEEGASPVEALVSALQTGTITRVTPQPRIRGAVTAPIAGRVVDILVGEGDSVKPDDVVVVLESMKTQVQVKAGVEGVVKEVYVTRGAAVKQGDPLLRVAEQ